MLFYWLFITLTKRWKIKRLGCLLVFEMYTNPNSNPYSYTIPESSNIVVILVECCVDGDRATCSSPECKYSGSTVSWVRQSYTYPSGKHSHVSRLQNFASIFFYFLFFAFCFVLLFFCFKTPISVSESHLHRDSWPIMVIVNTWNQFCGRQDRFH